MTLEFNPDVEYIHFDQFPLKHWELDEYGFLRFVAPISRIGKLKYSDSQGNHWDENVTPDVLIDSLDSFKMKPITSPHPPVPLDSKNTLPYLKGSSGHTGFFDNSFLWITGTIFDEKVIKGIFNKTCQEISPSYRAKLKLDGSEIFQAQRRGNHLSVVPHGRNGREVSFKTDSQEIFVTDDDLQAGDLPDMPECFKDEFKSDKQIFLPSIPKVDSTPLAGDSTSTVGNSKQTEVLGANKIMTQIILNDEVFTIDGADSDRLKEAISDLKKLVTDTTFKNDAATAETAELKANIENLQSQIGSLTGEKEALQVKFDEAETKVTVPIDLSKEISSRLSIWSDVLPAIQKYDSSFKLDSESEAWSLSPVQIKQLYLVKRYQASDKKDSAEKIAKIDLAETANQNYIEGLFDGLRSDSAVKDPTHSDSVLQALMNGKRQSSEDKQDASDDPRQKMIASIENNRAKALI
jgi:hypothetical protein